MFFFFLYCGTITLYVRFGNVIIIVKYANLLLFFCIYSCVFHARKIFLSKSLRKKVKKAALFFFNMGIFLFNNPGPSINLWQPRKFLENALIWLIWRKYWKISDDHDIWRFEKFCCRGEKNQKWQNMRQIPKLSHFLPKMLYIWLWRHYSQIPWHWKIWGILLPICCRGEKKNQKWQKYEANAQNLVFFPKMLYIWL